MKYITLSIIWAGYCFLHSFLISIRFTNFLTRRLKNYYAFYRVFYVIISLVLLIWVINYTSQQDNKIIIHYEAPWSVIRYVLIAGSLILFFRAFFFDYDSLSFFGIRQIQNFAKEDNAFVPLSIKKTGLLGVVRHPMYIALIIYLWCQIFTLADLIVNAILTVYVVIGTYLEEKKLILEFGDSYLKYQQEVPMLLPIKRTKVISTS